MKKNGRNHILSLFSANALQIVFSQLGGLFLFWLASKALPKNDFGNFNWYFAIYGTFTALLSFGFDFVVIKRISAKNEMDAARAQLLQNGIISLASLLPALLLLGAGLLAGQLRHTFFIFIAFVCTYLGQPFKNALTGKELFNLSARAVIIANVLKIALVLWFYYNGELNLQNASLVLAAGNFTEMLVYIINSRGAFDKQFFDPKLTFVFYRSLFKEALPQLGVIVFDSAFARIDWILLGLISGSQAALNTAEYSFAYKVFELSRLPLLILSPILFTRFSKLLHTPQLINNETRSGIFAFFKLEMVTGMIIPLLLNLAWTPLVLLFTAGKYGPENAQIYFLLSLTLPMQYAINFLWTMAFAQGQLRLTMALSIINSCLNIILNLLLIPKWGQNGAAIAYLACNALMLPIYFYKVKQQHIHFPLWPGLGIVIIAALVGLGCYALPANVIIKCLVALPAYILLIFACRIFSASQAKQLKHFIKKD